MKLDEAIMKLKRNGYRVIKEDTETQDDEYNVYRMQQGKSHHPGPVLAPKMNALLRKHDNLMDKIDNAKSYNEEAEKAGLYELMDRLQKKFDGDYGGASALVGYRVEDGSVNDFYGVGHIMIENSRTGKTFEIAVEYTGKLYIVYVKKNDNKTAHWSSSTVNVAFKDIVNYVKTGR